MMTDNWKYQKLITMSIGYILKRHFSPMYVIARLDRAIQRIVVRKIDEKSRLLLWITRSSRVMTSLSIFFIIMIPCLCSFSFSWEPYTPPAPIPNDRRTFPEPQSVKVNVWQNAYSRQMTQTTTRAFDFSRWVRAIGGNPRQALNVNAYDEVDSSSWFEHRNTAQPFSQEDIRRGPRTIDGPDTSGNWVIFKVKSEGMAPGFWIKDAQGNRFIIKPEIKGYPEVGTSAENITTLLFYAAGYHTPENYLSQVRLNRIKIKSGVKLIDERDVKRLMTQKDLEAIFDRVHVREDGTVRVTASRFIKGKPVGSFSFSGTRKDDPNDIVPHQHRRELRGLYVICSWLNHHDLNSGNFFESYITKNGQSYIGHYFLDFSSSLGASLFGAQPLVRGYVPLINPLYTFIVNPIKNWFHVPRWESNNPITYPAVGRFNNHIFKPDKFKINYPLAAFSLMTDRDAYWAAKLVMSFTDTQIQAVVKEGCYTDPKTDSILANILIERRDIIGRFWYNRVCPLERFRYDEKQSKLCFTDMGIKGNLYTKSESKYQYKTKHNGKEVAKSMTFSDNSCLDIPPPKPSKEDINEIEVVIQTARSKGNFSKPMNVFIQSDNSQAFRVVGITR
ncbi:MAG: hypothetical protein HQK83_06760 [Fibrobacteria bacterium]|nr:hypothetical protein [Fibrobacteria bacterium]